MTDYETRVLVTLSQGRDEFGYFSFAYIMRETGLDRETVRWACRSLTNKGLAQYASGLWTDEGYTAGSGYGITKKGADLIIAEAPR